MNQPIPVSSGRTVILALNQPDALFFISTLGADRFAAPARQPVIIRTASAGSLGWMPAAEVTEILVSDRAHEGRYFQEVGSLAKRWRMRARANVSSAE